MAQRIHIFGASGAGTTTLGAALARSLDVVHFDTDSYYWKPTDPPFVESTAIADRLRMFAEDTAQLDAWVLSGSLCSWGDPLVTDLTAAIFLYLDPTIRMQRLAERERQRYGERILPGGDMHAAHVEFIAWAESYDTAGAKIRSLAMHEAWMETLSCPVMRLNAGQTVAELLECVETRK